MLSFTRVSLSSTAVAMALTAGLGGYTAAAQGQNADSGDVVKLEEIVVTARKREESIDTVPLAITAMTSEKIEARNLKSLEDVAAFSPGFYVEQATATGTGRNDRSFRQLSFRGIGATGSNVGIRAGGVAFVDGSPVLNSSLANVQDLERVEVLRGPQAAYFGRSTFIGAVNYITKDPTDTWTGRLSSEFAQNNLTDTSLSASGPINDWASIRISGRNYAKDGQYVTANENRRLGDQSTKSLSATLLLKPLDGLKIRTTYTHFEDADGPPAQYLIGGTAAVGISNCDRGGRNGGYWCGTVPQKADPTYISANLVVTPAINAALLQNSGKIPIPFNPADYLSEFGLSRKADQFSNRVDYAFGDSGPTLTSVTAYHEEHVATLSDFTFRGGVNPSNGVAIGTVATAFFYKDHDWSQELRLVSSQENRLRWTIGGNYLVMKQPTGGVISTLGNFGGAAVGYDQAVTPAVFGGVYFDVLPKLTLSAEGRYQEDRVSGHYALTSTVFTDISKTYKSFSPRVSVDYKLTDNSTVYALYSKGTKPGGFNGTNIITAVPSVLAQLLAALPTAKAAFDEETLDNIEAGIKGSFLDNRLRLALDGYVGKYKKAQVPVTVVVTNPNGTPNTLGPTINIGNVDLKGVEFEGEAIVLPGLRLGATFAYTSTKIKDYFCSECSNILPQNAGIPTTGPSILPGSVNYTAPQGKRLPGTPELTYTLSANYDHKLTSELTGFVGADYLYRGKYYADAANIADSGASEIINARFGINTSVYSIELFARNLTDDRSPGITYNALAPGFGAANTLRVALPDGRRYGVRASINF